MSWKIPCTNPEKYAYTDQFCSHLSITNNFNNVTDTVRGRVKLVFHRNALKADHNSRNCGMTLSGRNYIMCPGALLQQLPVVSLILQLAVDK